MRGKSLLGSHRLWWSPDTPEARQGARAQSKTKTPRKRLFVKRGLKVLGNQKVREWIRTLPRAGPSQTHSGNLLEVTAGKLPYTTRKENDSQARARLGPAHKQKHTPLKALGLRSGCVGREVEQGSTLPRAGTQGSACTEEQPRPFLPAPHPATSSTSNKKEPGFPRPRQHEWNSPETAEGIQQQRSLISLLLEGEKVANSASAG